MTARLARTDNRLLAHTCNLVFRFELGDGAWWQGRHKTLTSDVVPRKHVNTDLRCCCVLYFMSECSSDLGEGCTGVIRPFLRR